MKPRLALTAPYCAPHHTQPHPPSMSPLLLTYLKPHCRRPHHGHHNCYFICISRFPLPTVAPSRSLNPTAWPSSPCYHSPTHSPPLFHPHRCSGALLHFTPTPPPTPSPPAQWCPASFHPTPTSARAVVPFFKVTEPFSLSRPTTMQRRDLRPGQQQATASMNEAGELVVDISWGNPNPGAFKFSSERWGQIRQGGWWYTSAGAALTQVHDFCLRLNWVSKWECMCGESWWWIAAGQSPTQVH